MILGVKHTDRQHVPWWDTNVWSRHCLESTDIIQLWLQSISSAYWTSWLTVQQQQQQQQPNKLMFPIPLDVTFFCWLPVTAVAADQAWQAPVSCINAMGIKCPTLIWLGWVVAELSATFAGLSSILLPPKQKYKDPGNAKVSISLAVLHYTKDHLLCYWHDLWSLYRRPMVTTTNGWLTELKFYISLNTNRSHDCILITDYNTSHSMTGSTCQLLVELDLIYIQPQ